MDIVVNNSINNLIVLVYYLKNYQNIDFNNFVDIFILDGIEIIIDNNDNNILFNYYENLISKIDKFFNVYIHSLYMTRYDYLKNILNRNIYFNIFKLYDIYKEKINNFKNNWKELIKLKYYIILHTNNIENFIINIFNYDLVFKNKLKLLKNNKEILNLVDIEIEKIKNNLKTVKYYNYNDEIIKYFNLEYYQIVNQLKIYKISNYIMNEFNYLSKIEEYIILIDNEIENFKQIIVDKIPNIYDLDTLDINIIKYIRKKYIYNETQKTNLINQIRYYNEVELYSDYFKNNFINLEQTLKEISTKKKYINLNFNTNNIINYQKKNNIFKSEDIVILNNFLTDFNKDHIIISDTLEYYLTPENIILTTENYYNFKKYLYDISKFINIDFTNITTYKNSLIDYIISIYDGINYQTILNLNQKIIIKTNLKYKNYFYELLEGKTLNDIKDYTNYYFYNLLNRYLQLLEEEFKNDDIIDYIKNCRNNDRYNISKQLNSNSSEKIFNYLNIKIEDDYFKKLEFIL